MTSQPTIMPAAFFGHGSPMNAMEQNRYTKAWHAFGRGVPKPRAILVISAHWYINATAVTAMARPRTIHDFYGFPKKLFEVDYPAPGSPEIAEEIAEIVKPINVGLDHDSWGIDHGTWSVLVHAFPKADIPVIQLAINSAKELDFHFDLGVRLAPLRERGIMILGSGNVVHNLRAIEWSQPEHGFDWAKRFNEAALSTMISDPAAVPHLQSHKDYLLSVPTPDHFIPFVYLAGLASAGQRPAEVLIDGYAYGSLSMTSFSLDCRCQTDVTDERPSAALPDPSIVPPEDTNM